MPEAPSDIRNLIRKFVCRELIGKSQDSNSDIVNGTSLGDDDSGVLARFAEPNASQALEIHPVVREKDSLLRGRIFHLRYVRVALSSSVGRRECFKAACP